MTITPSTPHTSGDNSYYIWMNMYLMLLMTSQCAMQLKEKLERSGVATLLVSSPSTSGWPAGAFAAAVDMDALLYARLADRHANSGLRVTLTIAQRRWAPKNRREGAGVSSLMAGCCRPRLCLRSLPKACIHMCRGLPRHESHTGAWPECSVRQLQAPRSVGHTCT